MVMLGDEVEGGGGVVWGRGAFFKMLYMFKIFFMVALGNYVTFSPNLSKFSEGSGDDLFDKSFRNFLPLF